MEPRELWERNTVLAEAFCASDERVRRVQADLDDAQAARTRTLAAFAVTVGNDGTTADVMGLNEREVRLARRTVGKDDARTLASDLLKKAAEPSPPPPEEPEPAAPSEPPASEVPWVPGPRKDWAPSGVQAPSGPQVSAQNGVVPHTAAPYAGTAHTAAPYAGTAHASAADATAYGVPVGEAAPAAPAAPAEAPPTHGPVREETAWSPAMDSVLLWSWQSGIDLQAVAAELDLDVRALLQRVQTLAAEGLLVLKTQHADTGHAGRHRRHDEFFVSAPDSPEELYTQAGYVTHPY